MFICFLESEICTEKFKEKSRKCFNKVCYGRASGNAKPRPPTAHFHQFLPIHEPNMPAADTSKRLASELTGNRALPTKAFTPTKELHGRDRRSC